MLGVNNNDYIVLDSTTGSPKLATVTAQLAADPCLTTLVGHLISSPTAPSTLEWEATAAGTSMSDAVVAFDSPESGEPDPQNDCCARR
jgi:hypothetical protein